MDENAIIQGLIDKDKIIQAEFYQIYFKRLIPALDSFLKSISKQEIEDIVVDTILKFIEKPSLINKDKFGSNGLSGLLYVSVRNKVLDVIRKQNREPDNVELDDEVHQNNILDLIKTDLYQTNEDTDLEIEARKLDQAIEDALPETKNLHRKLRYNGDLEGKEIAEYIDKSPNAERKAWHDLKRKIDKIISQELTNHPEKYSALIEKTKELDIKYFH